MMESSPPNPTSTSTVSVADFLKSSCLSNDNVILPHEKKRAPSFLSPSCADDGRTDGRRSSEPRVILENATRVALLLTRAFADRCNVGNDNAALSASANYLSTLNLDDFLISSTVSGRDEPPIGQGQLGEGLVVLLGIAIKNGQEKTPSSSDFSAASCNEYHYLQFQVLGKLLYSVYTRGQPTPSDLFTSPPSTPSPPTQEIIEIFDTDDEDETVRSGKVMRTSESSVFSRLVEGNTLPVPICRCLSDLIDIGPGGKADWPFASFGDVSQDLEQMIDKPDIFLHDLSVDLQTSLQPIFGRRYFGQEENISKLMGIAAGEKTGSDRPKRSKTEAVFVSGIAGSGKSHLIQVVADNLSNPGWIKIQAKFERGIEHASRSILSSMFNELINYLVKMKEKGASPSDVAYGERASRFIVDEIGEDGLSSLVDFLPSLPHLFNNLCDSDTQKESVEMKAEESKTQLILCLTKILEAVLGSITDNRMLMIICEDMQWADKTSLALLGGLLMNIGCNDKIRRRCLFVGSYRDNDVVDESHPLVIQRSSLEKSFFVNITGIKISSLSKEAVTDMITTELRLPKRMVLGLSEEIHKKTSEGHAYFVVELLNSLVRDGTIAYSIQKRLYTWDAVSISMLETGDNVAALIASNLSYLSSADRRILQILSCFGTQTDTGLLKILDGFQAGVLSSIDGFVEKGILDRAGSIVIFAHDLIQQECASWGEQKSLHLQLGEYLGSEERVAQHGMQQLQLDDEAFFSGKASMTSSLITLSCDQVNSAGPESVCNKEKRRQFAQWNLAAGQNCSKHSNFEAALHYYSKGTAFLFDDHWRTDTQLCTQLHEGAVLAAFALGETDNVTRFADKVVGNTSFKETLEVQQVVLRSYSQAGRDDECLFKGIEILRKLDFNIELSPSKESIMSAVRRTEGIVSQYSLDQIMDLCEANIDDSTHSIVKIMDTFFVPRYILGSPCLPLIASAIVEFSLHNGICVESATAFAYFGCIKVSFGDFTGAQYFASVSRAIIAKHQTRNKSKIRAEIMLLHTIDIWFKSPKDISQNLLNVHNDAMKTFQVDVALYSLRQSCRFKLLGGENLALIFQSSDDRLKLIAKHSKYSASNAVLDNVLLAHLMGKPDWTCSSVFEGSMQNIMDGIEAEARSSKDNFLLFTVYFYKLLIAFWQDEYDAAEKFSLAATEMIPTLKMLPMSRICHTFFSGLVAFYQYRKFGCENILQTGKAMLDKFEGWALNCPAVFENRMLLLKAEYLLSINENDLAERCYIKSIDISRDYGNIHELALGYELLGRYYFSHVSPTYSTHCFRQSYIAYMQWGASAVASRILCENPSIDMQSEETDLSVGNKKHVRHWETGSPSPELLT